MDVNEKYYRNRHRVNLFSHIDNDSFNDEFFSAVEAFKDEIMDLIRVRPNHVRDISRKSLDQMSLIELVKIPEVKLGVRSLKFPMQVSKKGRNLILDQYLIAPIIYNELNHLRSCQIIALDDAISYVQLSALDAIFGKMGVDKITHDSRNEFFSCYINSFIKDDHLRLKYSLQSSISMSYGTEDHWPFSYFSESTLGSLRHATLLNAAQYLGINVSDKIKTCLKCFPDERINNFIQHNFLGGDLQEYSEKLQAAMEWISEKGTDHQLKDWVIGDWLSHQCAIFYAHHLQEDMLKTFIHVMIESIADSLEYDRPVLESIKEALFRQSILIDPIRFADNGYSKIDFLKPLSLNDKKLEKSLSSINGIYTKSTENNFSWLVLPTIYKIQDQCEFKITTDDIVQNFIGKDFQVAALKFLRPNDYLDSFINGMDDRSNTHLHAMAKELMEIYKDMNDVERLQSAYLLKITEKNKDKPLNSKKLGLNWANKSKCINDLRDAGLLGSYSAISVLGLTAQDLKNDMHSLSNVSKRMILANELEV